MSQLSPDAIVQPRQITGTVSIRTAKASDIESLSVYFTGLSSTTRNKRFMGARTDTALLAAECVARADNSDHFTLLAELSHGEGPGTIIGEMRYAYDAAARYGDFAISVADLFQRKGVGLQLMNAMERQASDLGHEMIAAETARANAEMRALPRRRVMKIPAWETGCPSISQNDRCDSRGSPAPNPFGASRGTPAGLDRIAEF